MPDGFNLFLLQRRITLRSLVQEHLLRLIRLPEPLQRPSRKMGKRLISRPLQDTSTDIIAASCIIPGWLRIHLFINSHPAFMPDNLAGICPKDKSGRIQRIVIKEWERFLYRSFDCDIMFRIPCLFYRKIHMELRPRCLTILFLHMIPARCHRIVNFLKKLFQLFKCDPVLRILRMVIVTVHHDDI